MKLQFKFEEVARLPLPGDNVAIATRKLRAGTMITYQGQELTIDYTVMEGHRFAVKAIPPGDALLSFELPFGIAKHPIEPGNYVINQGALEALQVRSLAFPLPEEPNFTDQMESFILNEATFKPAPPLPTHANPPTFMGYRRELRGVGTRNTIVLLGITSRTGSYVKQLANQFRQEISNYPQIDGVVPIAHTEGSTEHPNNLSLLLRTLAGFIVNPNVGAILLVGDKQEPVTNQMVIDYARKHHYPIDDVIHHSFFLTGDFQESLKEGEQIVRNWLPIVNDMKRTPESISNLKIALQCGGSDAFSGISANPLLGWLSKEIVRYGGAANLAETDELIGAEPYVLQKVRNIETAQKFLSLVEQFKEQSAWHGANAEGNPSGGNKYRGLYNIFLKSIGAARKKDPDTRLDYVIDYGERMQPSGFHFMDSPGNDLESVAGQVASGCNLIFFTTGNGSITNFPFVPTLKVVTTSKRYQLLSKDMDINAGAYLDGISMDELGKNALALTVETASGKRSVGEKAGHVQVQIWRNWQQTDDSNLATLLHKPKPSGEPVPIDQTTVASFPFSFSKNQDGSVGLILPTSLCSGQVGNLIANRLNEQAIGKSNGLLRFVSLAHTEGCGNSAGDSEETYTRTMLSYVTHPLVKSCLLLEHGCEKTHNDYMKNKMTELGINQHQLGFASIQGDGGIDKVTKKVEAWFDKQLERSKPSKKTAIGLEGLNIGLLIDGPMTNKAAEQLSTLTKLIVKQGGLTVVPENSPLLLEEGYLNHLLSDKTVSPSLSYGEHVNKNGFHIMETPTTHWVETITGLAATGVELMIVLTNDRPLQTHPFVPMLQMTTSETINEKNGNDLDLFLTGDPTTWIAAILNRCKDTLEYRYTPKLFKHGNIDFQLTRGFLGVSL
ncbi:UxaA family hydrolase [Aquibacillus salsiterrae]|uniref:Altronate dehydratase n=1 Tax=Aquibacillus salsiterrae TaxID=2950439 RepID=A0A9X3WF15_9BACI|nr:UxaA family hydrolase [Aquibacillus salsiterrae]MDC3416219.1 altronate dehydratase [Aquibacillus salsiterrae]